jgi:hypothetical protein
MAGVGGASLLGGRWLSRLPSAHAEPGDIRRLVIVHVPNEPIGREYWAIAEPGAKNVPIGELPSSVLAPLEPYKNRLRIIGDLTNQIVLDKNWHTDSSHFGILYGLTGVAAIPYADASEKGDEWAGGPSVDKYIAAELGVESLVLGVGSPHGDVAVNRAFFWAAKQNANPIRSPKEAFDEVFASFQIPEDEFAKMAQQRASVVDVVAKDLASLSSRLPSADKQKLERHLDEIRALEKKMAQQGALLCTEIPAGPGEDPGYYPEIGRRHIDVAVQALQCDARRVVGLQFGDSGQLSSPGPYDWPDEPWPEGGLFTTDTEHEVAHKYNQEGTTQQVNERRGVETFYVGQLRYLLDRLSAVEEADGRTLLDSTLVMFVHPMGYDHKQVEHLFLFAGGDDFIQTGQFDSYPGHTQNEILAGVCRAMGLPNESYGDPDYPGYIDLG